MGNSSAQYTIIGENFSRIKHLSLIFLGYALFVLFSDFGPYQVWNPVYLGIYQVADVTFSILAVLSALFYWFYKRENFAIQNLSVKIGLFWILIWAAVVSGIELTTLGYSALTLLLLIAVLFIFTNLVTAIFYATSSFVALVITLYLQGHLDKSVLPHLLIILPIAVIATIVSARNYNSKLNELVTKHTLIDLNRELHSSKDNLEEEVKRRTTELYEAKEKAEESDRLKSAFLANMSHEIRTPMNGILGFAELLKEPGLTGEQQQEYISIIEKGGERLLNIINNLIDISRIESGIMELVYSETNINQQLAYIHTFFEPDAAKKGVSFSVTSLLPDEASKVFTDKEKLLAILTNLVKNAIKYCDQGAIEIGCSLKNGGDFKEWPDLQAKQFIQFQVKDSGIGIAKERQQAIFERFIQADIIDSEARQGAGLGLSIAKSYIEMLGGKIWLKSNQEENNGEKGTTFYFILPIRQHNNNPMNDMIATPATNDSADSKLAKVMIAEDDETSSLFLEILLKKYTSQILKARTGKEAVKIFSANPDIQLILMDIRLPEINGYAATKQIRKLDKQVIIFAQTAFALAGDREKALEAGCNDYLTKPVQEAVLKELIREHFPL